MCWWYNLYLYLLSLRHTYPSAFTRSRLLLKSKITCTSIVAIGLDPLRQTTHRQLSPYRCLRSLLKSEPCVRFIEEALTYETYTDSAIDTACSKKLKCLCSTKYELNIGIIRSKTNGINVCDIIWGYYQISFLNGTAHPHYTTIHCLNHVIRPLVKSLHIRSHKAHKLEPSIQNIASTALQNTAHEFHTLGIKCSHDHHDLLLIPHNEYTFNRSSSGHV